MDKAQRQAMRGPVKSTEADRKSGSGICDFGANTPSNALEACEKKSEEHEVKSEKESLGCSEDATGLDTPYYYYYYWCYDAKKVVKHGTVDCKWYEDEKKCDIDKDTFSITNLKYYFCRHGDSQTYYPEGTNGDLSN